MSRVAIDIGGTFTDVVAMDERGAISVGKSLSTPSHLLEGILTGLRYSGTEVEDVDFLLHGSTVVINSLIERRGADTALITTEGFRDVYEIGRVNRPDAFNLAFRRPRPLIPRRRVFEAPERMRADGSVHRSLDEAAVREIARRLRVDGVESVAVALLHAYRNPDHEIRIGEILAEELPGVFVSLSHELSREYREYERTSTVAANAFVGPVVADYLAELDRAFEGSGGAIAIMQSNGGLAGIERIRRQSVQMLESGPAGGVVGTIETCRRLGYEHAIAFDMGGTTAKASIVRDLAFPIAAEYFVGGYAEGLPIRVPCLDIVEVGTGGGSIASVDVGGGIRVGPRSAGSEPGPACYGRGGTDATVTDASLVLGIIDSNQKLSGGLELHADAARDAVSAVADQLGLSTPAAAGGILQIAAASMATAVRAVTTERGLDPRDFAMFAYGGNGPVHASLIARELGITRVVIPVLPSVFSAIGMLLADLRHDVVQTRIQPLAGLDAGFQERIDALKAECLVALQEGGMPDGPTRHLIALDMRYVGQEHVLTLPIDDAPIDPVGLAGAFDEGHRVRFGHAAPGQPVEIVSLRVSAIRSIARTEPEVLPAGSGSPSPESRRPDRLVLFDIGAEPLRCAVYERAALLAGDEIEGPAAIEEETTTTLLRPGDRAVVDATGALLLEIGAAR
ncbi:hydantoinase/oxoprolinase family protein [Amnibacterium flavum]|uniref:5-oxoprolinase n=1 Tax=Amnibacterium flavum TaxID=2173173 RepID=A0A2V1HTU6_9MICO|nr:hydantoinase/oxoprolinase family protein [Amnibacterium flavum]PVZ95741.1 5-oxoprolinase [Amnibacterium flavum]